MRFPAKVRVDLDDKPFDRRVVDREVMAQEPHKPALSCPVFGDVRTDEGRSAHVDAMAPRVDARAELRHGVAAEERQFLDWH
jgi:hypothetical protein